MNEQQKAIYQAMVELFNHNLRTIKRELNSRQISELYSKYNPEDDGHLSKILTLRNIRLLAQ